MSHFNKTKKNIKATKELKNILAKVRAMDEWAILEALGPQSISTLNDNLTKAIDNHIPVAEKQKKEKNLDEYTAKLLEFFQVGCESLDYFRKQTRDIINDFNINNMLDAGCDNVIDQMIACMAQHNKNEYIVWLMDGLRMYALYGFWRDVDTICKRIDKRHNLTKDTALTWVMRHPDIFDKRRYEDNYVVSTLKKIIIPLGQLYRQYLGLIVIGLGPSFFNTYRTGIKKYLEENSSVWKVLLKSISKLDQVIIGKAKNGEDKLQHMIEVRLASSNIINLQFVYDPDEQILLEKEAEYYETTTQIEGGDDKLDINTNWFDEEVAAMRAVVVAAQPMTNNKGVCDSNQFIDNLLEVEENPQQYMEPLLPTTQSSPPSDLLAQMDINRTKTGNKRAAETARMSMVSKRQHLTPTIQEQNIEEQLDQLFDDMPQ